MLLKRTVIQAWVVGASLVGCSTTYIREDAGQDGSVSIDAPETADALTPSDSRDAQTRVDAPNLDAFAPDAPNLDAFTPLPDAFTVPTEVCNGTDDDFDSAIDEGGTAQCQLAPRAEMASCTEGRCQCRPTGTLATPGTYEDCNTNFADGCEVPLGTDANCRACGNTCDLASQCRFNATTGFACGPADILDFSTASIRGDIGCIVRTDHRVICRGQNTEWAISDEAEETATLGWTATSFALDPRLPGWVPTRPEEVRVWQHRRDDGREVMSVCIRDRANANIFCRGDNSTGLHASAERSRRRGVSGIVAARGVTQWSTWGGEGVLVANNNYENYVEFLIWGGTRTVWPWFRGSAGASPRLVRGDIPLLTSPPHRFSDDVPWTYFQLVTWGRAPSWLLVDPNVDSDFLYPDGVMTGTMARELPSRDTDCARDVCCLAHPEPDDHIRVGCWGRHLRGRDEVTWVDGLPNVSIPVVEGAPVADRRLIELSPRADGRIEGCVRIDGRFFCADMTTAADTVGPVSPEPFREEPTRVFGARTPQARVDWQAMCIQHRPDWWQCWGTHEGWGHE